MSEMKVNFSKMKEMAENEAELSRELEQVEGEIVHILSSLAMRSARVEAIRKKLHRGIKNVSDAKKKLEVLSSALSDIVRLYQSTETHLANSDEGRKPAFDTEKSIQEVWDKIKDVAKKFGLDSSAAYSKDPINLSNGNYVYEKVCMELETELAMQFRIFYNVQNETGKSLGKGWTHTWEIGLERLEDQISMILDDSSRYIFLKENGEYRPAPGTMAVWKPQETGGMVTDKNGISYFFDASGCLLYIENLAGGKITLEYDLQNRLSRAVDRRGNFFRFTYNDKGNLQFVEDMSGRKVTLFWKDGQLSGVSDPGERETRYRYDSSGRLTEVINGRRVTCLVNTYDDQGRAVHQKFSDGGEITCQYLDEKNQVVVREQNGNEIIYEHDEFLRNTRTIYMDGEETATFDENHNRLSMTDKRGNISYFSYDASGNMTSFCNAVNDELTFAYTAKNQLSLVKLNGITLHQADYDERDLQVRTEDANGAVDRYEYDSYGQPVVWERADGSRIKMTYDVRGNLSSITNAAGGCIHYEYNDRNQVIKNIDALGNETFYEYNDSDELVRVQDAAGNVQSYEYDACGNLTKVIEADGKETVTEYNSMNKPVCVTESDGGQTRYEYDTMWNVTSITAPDGGTTRYEYNRMHYLTRVTDANGGVNQMEYDPCGNLVRRVDPDGGIHQLGYDALNRPNYVCDPVGMEVRAEYDALGNVTAVLYQDGSAEHYEYDFLGQMTMAQDQTGYQKFYEYDRLGNLKTVSDSTGILEQYSYYPGGLLESEKYIDGSSRTFFYDSNENVTRIVNQDGNSWRFTYDCLGRVVRAAQDEGIEESYEYDALGNITAIIDGNGVKTRYQYRKSEITSVTDGFGNVTYFTYDLCHRLTKVIQPGKEYLDPEEINGFNRSQKDVRITDYHYDKNGNIIETIDPEGNVAHYTYDGNNRILSQIDEDGYKTCCEYHLDGTVKAYQFGDGKTIKLLYDPLKRLVQMEDWLGVTRIQADKGGKPKQVTMPGNESISYEWGERGECKGIVYPDGSKVSYDYDEALRLSQCSIGKDKVSYQYYPNGKLKGKLFPDHVKTCYQYHPTGLLSEIRCMKEEELLDRITYEYDRNNRKSRISRRRPGMEDSGMFEYQYNSVGNLTSVKKDGIEKERYEYDGYGNRVFSQTQGTAANYTYNRLNQLIKMSDEAGEHTYSYDRRGNLLLEHLNGNVIRQLRFGAQGLLERVKQAGRTVDYQYDGFGNRVRKTILSEGNECRETDYLYDITKNYNHVLHVREGQGTENVIWDGGILACVGMEGVRYHLNDERMSPLRIIQSGRLYESASFDSFGNMVESVGQGVGAFGYAGYRPDSVSGFMHVNARDYDARTGRFISKDVFAGMITLSLTFNAYSYVMGDPVNRYDPTGMLAAWLAGGIVGAAAKVASKVAGDIVESVATGKIHVSSWQSYVGAAAGGFTYGTVFVAAGGSKAAAGAASAAVETLTTNGLNMLTGVEGYRKEDGYTWKNLVGETAYNAATGAAASYLFDNSGKWVKVPGINKGKGSFQAVWKGVMTKAAKGQIKNITCKTIGKGIVAYGGLHLFDEVLQKGWKKAKDMAKDVAINAASSQIMGMLSGNKGSAACPVEG